MSWPRCCRSVRRGVFKTRGNGSARITRKRRLIGRGRLPLQVFSRSRESGPNTRRRGSKRISLRNRSRFPDIRSSAVRYENNRFSRYVRKNFIRPSRIDGLLYSGGRAMSRTESSSLRLRYGAERDDRSWESSSMRSGIPISKDYGKNSTIRMTILPKFGERG